MNDPHIIEDDLTEGWLDDLAASFVRKIEDLLFVHAAFQAEYPEPEPS